MPRLKSSSPALALLTSVLVVSYSPSVLAAPMAKDASFCKALADVSYELAVGKGNGVARETAESRARSSGFAPYASPTKLVELVEFIYRSPSAPSTLDGRNQLERDCLAQGKQESQDSPESMTSSPLGAAASLLKSAEVLAAAVGEARASGLRPATVGELVANRFVSMLPNGFDSDTPLNAKETHVAVPRMVCTEVLRKVSGQDRPEIPKWQPAGQPWGYYLFQGEYVFFVRL